MLRRATDKSSVPCVTGPPVVYYWHSAQFYSFMGDVRREGLARRDDENEEGVCGLGSIILPKENWDRNLKLSYVIFK
jgi:hypothetical protein